MASRQNVNVQSAGLSIPAALTGLATGCHGYIAIHATTLWELMDMHREWKQDLR